MQPTTDQPQPAKQKKIKYQHKYEHDNLASINLISIGLICIIVALGGFIFVQFGTDPAPVRFLLTEDKQLITPNPLNQPAMSDAALLNWVAEIVNIAYSFNYLNMDKQSKRLQEYFDNRGLDTYKKLLKTDENLRRVVSEQYVVSVKPERAPEIIRDGIVDGRYAWQIQMPIKMTLQNATVILEQNLNVDLLIWRVPETDVPVGLKVTKFSSKVISRYKTKSR